MAKDLGIEMVTATVLANRGIQKKQHARAFLSEEAGDFEGILSMKDGALGLSIMKEAIEQKKKIAIYGDYDVDGVMSTSILYQTFIRCGGEAIYYIPDREKEGYGMNLQAVERLAEQGVEVLMTCDNGIVAFEEIQRAKELGMMVVVLDHHEADFKEQDAKTLDYLPKADAIINPKQRACPYAFKMLCAGGISYFFALEMLNLFGIKDGDLEEEILCFASIATVCDIVDLMYENRTIVQRGLKAIMHTKNYGLRALILQNEIDFQQLTEYHFGFIIGPCINAVGRLKIGQIAVDLFTCKDKTQAETIATELIQLNEQRKELTKIATERLIAQVEAKESLPKVLVLYDGEIHESIAGIVAGRIKEQFNRPTIVMTKAKEGAKGSGRSIEGYSMFEGLYAQKELFTRFGGHAMAAGLSLPIEHIEPLRERLNEACLLKEEDFVPVLRFDKVLHFKQIQMKLVEEMQKMSPFGSKNQKPYFASREVSIAKFSVIGKQKNILKFSLEQEGIFLGAISFDGYDFFIEQLKELYGAKECGRMVQRGECEARLHILYTLDINVYQGKSSIQLVVKEFKFVL